MPVAPTELVLFRHAESEWNAQGRWQGQADPPLSEQGRAQAREAARKLDGNGHRFAALYASDLVRAHETARILGRALGLPPRLAPGLREFHVGAWSGLTHAQIEARWPGQYARFRRREPDLRPPGGETPGAFLARILRALEELALRHAGRELAVVSHGGVARSLVPGTNLRNLESLHLRRVAPERWEPVG